MKFTVLTLFPEFFKTPLESSVIKRAIDDGIISVDLCSLRQFGEGHYKAVDDRPYGGGPGMVLMPEVVEKALIHTLGGIQKLEMLEKSVQDNISNPTQDILAKNIVPRVVYLSPQGNKLTAKKARELSSYKNLILLCGHYEGVDERIIDTFVHEEISIGDFVLTGGEPAALCLIDSVSRFVPNVIGQASSVNEDSFESISEEMVAGGLKAPMYTRPQNWKGKGVPEVLLSGNHGEIKKWRYLQSLKRTRARRPDLLENKK